MTPAEAGVRPRRPLLTLVTDKARVCSATHQARAGAASVALLSGTADPDLWAGATVLRDGPTLLARWTDARSGLPVTVRVSPPQRSTGGAVEATAEWTLGSQGRGSAQLRVLPHGRRRVRLQLTVFGEPGTAAHALQPASAAFLERLAGAAERRARAS